MLNSKRLNNHIMCSNTDHDINVKLNKTIENAKELIKDYDLLIDNQDKQIDYLMETIKQMQQEINDNEMKQSIF